MGNVQLSNGFVTGDIATPRVDAGSFALANGAVTRETTVDDVRVKTTDKIILSLRGNGTTPQLVMWVDSTVVDSKSFKVWEGSGLANGETVDYLLVHF